MGPSFYKNISERYLSFLPFAKKSEPTNGYSAKKFIPKKSKLNYSSSSSSSATSSFSSSTKSGNKSSHKVPLERQRSPTKQIIQCTQKKPSRPHHYARLSAGDLEQLSDGEDEVYDIDPEASEVPVSLPPPSPAEIKDREEKNRSSTEKTYARN